jgi:glycosyltransferase involved in cell wall biosynthesis
VSPPDYAIVIPAYNEQDALPATLDAVRRAMDAVALRGELVVVDNNSSDRTAEIAREAGARVVFEPVNQISRARNAGARATTAPLLVFLDADTLLGPELLRAALRRLRSGRCAVGGARPAFDRPVPFIGRAILGFFNWLCPRARFAPGCFLFCLREGWEAVGGFSERLYASEEIWFCRDVGRWGRTRHLGFHIIPDPPVVTSGRKLHWFTRPQMVLLGLLALVPFTYRSRSLCRLWYHRPGRGMPDDR